MLIIILSLLIHLSIGKMHSLSASHVNKATLGRAYVLHIWLAGKQASEFPILCAQAYRTNGVRIGRIKLRARLRTMSRMHRPRLAPRSDCTCTQVQVPCWLCVHIRTRRAGSFSQMFPAGFQVIFSSVFLETFLRKF